MAAENADPPGPDCQFFIPHPCHDAGVIPFDIAIIPPIAIPLSEESRSASRQRATKLAAEFLHAAADMFHTRNQPATPHKSRNDQTTRSTAITFALGEIFVAPRFTSCQNDAAATITFTGRAL